MQYAYASRSRGSLPVGLRIAAGAALLAAIVLVAPSSARADAKSYLPPAVGGFRLTKPAVGFTPANLENHIDGGAEAVKKYDFRLCAYGEYAPGGRGGQLLTVDIYQMGSPLDAFGYYSSQRPERGTYLKIGAEGYREPTDLNFWKGACYVKLTITASNAPPAFQQAMTQIANAIAAKLPGPSGTPALLGLLPPGFAPHTDKYVRSSVFAQNFLNNAAVARYPGSGPQAELFIAALPNPAAAKMAFSRYQAFIAQPSGLAVGTKPTPLKGIGDTAVAVHSRFSGFHVAAVKGKYVIAVRKAKDAASALAIVKAAVARAK